MLEAILDPVRLEVAGDTRRRDHNVAPDLFGIGVSLSTTVIKKVTLFEKTVLVGLSIVLVLFKAFKFIGHIVYGVLESPV